MNPKIHGGGAVSCPECGEHRFYPTLNDDRSLLTLDCANPGCGYFSEVNAGDHWPNPLEIR